MSSPWRVRNSSGSDGSGQSRTSSRPPGSQRGPGGGQDAPAHRAAGGGRTGSRPGRTRRPWPGLGRLGLRGSSIRSVRPSASIVGARPGDRVRLELDADELERREAARHRDEPAAAAAVDVDDPAAARQVGDELGQRGQDLLEEDRDVLAGQPLDGGPVAVRAVADRRAGPEEVGHPAPVHRGDDGVDELAAEELGALVVEQDGGDVLVDRQAAVLEGRQVVRVGRPRPGLDAPSASVPVVVGELGRASARLRPARADPREQPELDARGRRARSGGSRPRLAIRSSKRSSWPIAADCRMRPDRPSATPTGTVASMQRLRRAAGSGW